MDDLNQYKLDQDLSDDQLNQIDAVQDDAEEKADDSERYSD